MYFKVGFNENQFPDMNMREVQDTGGLEECVLWMRLQLSDLLLGLTQSDASANGLISQLRDSPTVLRKTQMTHTTCSAQPYNISHTCLWYKSS